MRWYHSDESGVQQGWKLILSLRQLNAHMDKLRWKLGFQRNAQSVVISLIRPLSYDGTAAKAVQLQRTCVFQDAVQGAMRMVRAVGAADELDV